MDLWPLPLRSDSQCEDPNRKWKDYLAVDCNTTDQRWHSCAPRSARRPLLPQSPSQIHSWGYCLFCSDKVHVWEHLTRATLCPLCFLEEQKVIEQWMFCCKKCFCYTRVSSRVIFGLYVWKSSPLQIVYWWSFASWFSTNNYFHSWKNAQENYS